MNIVQALLGEHGAMYPLLDRIETGIASGSLEELRFDVQMLQSTLISHAELEESILRPAILAFLPPPAPGPSDHDVVREGLDRAVQTLDDAELRHILRETVAFTRRHFRKEETQIFRIASRELSPALQEQLGQEWATRRGVALS